MKTSDQINTNVSSDITIFTDGGSRGNPGRAAYGFVIYNDKNETLIERGEYIGITTNNVAEYMGIIKALEWVRDSLPTTPSQISCFMDSLLVASQLSGKYKVKTEHIRNLFFTVKRIEQTLNTSISFTAIRREQNTEADRMVNFALDNER